MKPSSECRDCPLCEGRTNIVYPDGDLDSKVVFIGEAPGENEDLMGKPFVGRAGKILDSYFEEAGIDRKSILITNSVKCRPPNNRDPTREEMQACKKYLDSELEKCTHVVLLGRSSIKDFLGYEGKLEDIVNTEQKRKIGDHEIIFIPAYHPMSCVYRKNSRESLRKTMSLVKGIIR